MLATTELSPPRRTLTSPPKGSPPPPSRRHARGDERLVESVCHHVTRARVRGQRCKRPDHGVTLLPDQDLRDLTGAGLCDEQSISVICVVGVDTTRIVQPGRDDPDRLPRFPTRSIGKRRRWQSECQGRQRQDRESHLDSHAAPPHWLAVLLGGTLPFPPAGEPRPGAKRRSTQDSAICGVSPLSCFAALPPGHGSDRMQWSVRRSS